MQSYVIPSKGSEPDGQEENNHGLRFILSFYEAVLVSQKVVLLHSFLKDSKSTTMSFSKLAALKESLVHRVKNKHTSDAA